MVFAWDYLISSSHIYPGLRLLFHSCFWLKFSIHIGPVLCIYSPRLYSLLESFISGWKRSRYNTFRWTVLDITLPAIFQRECRLCWQWSKSERMLSETHVCLRADYLYALQLTQIRIIITRNHVNRWCFFVCVHCEDSLQRRNKLWVTVQ
jgi:hypothetical protein